MNASDEARGPSLARLAGASAGVFVAGACLSATAAGLLSAVGQGDAVLRLAQALGAYVRWRLPAAPGPSMALALFGGNLLACAAVALAGVGASALEMRARAGGGLLDRFFLAAYKRPAAVGRLFPAVLDCPPQGPRTGLTVGCVAPPLCLFANGLYAGVAAACALWVQRVPPAKVALALAHAPLELAALSVSAGLGLLFCAALASEAGPEWRSAALGGALRVVFSPRACASVLAALAASAIVETWVVAVLSS